MVKDKSPDHVAAKVVPSDTGKTFDFTVDPLSMDDQTRAIYYALSRQHKLASEVERANYPHPDGRTMTGAEIEARGISLDHPVVSSTCCA
jgi:hypothetical protein